MALRFAAALGLAGLAAVPAGGMAVLAVAAGSLPALPSASALSDIPPALLGAYVADAARCPGLPWPVLAAVGKVESDHGRSGGATMAADGSVSPPILGPALDGAGGRALVPDSDGGRLDGDDALDRAVGPMQVLPSTWAAAGRDASGDGVADPNNAFDAIATAAALLCGRAGRVDDPAAALRSYDHSDAYVARVLATAASYAQGPPSLDGAGATASVQGLLADPAVHLPPPAVADLGTGLVDPRLVAVLVLAGARAPIAVSVLRSGHSQCVGGASRAERPTCRVSLHWSYRAVDIAAVGGVAVTAANGAARDLAVAIAALPPGLRPDEVGTPWPALDPLPGFFSDADHTDHLHLGWEAPGAAASTSHEQGEQP
ncbi:MAG TPA: hypothetical protein VFJ85_01910 [Acidimicrobiales bacterium]|nr:hypothetical protein [Acidimicrobiales bacterium]